MEHLPFEVIEKILSCSSLRIEDVVNFSSTCRRFRNSVLSSPAVWKQKLHYNYPTLMTDLFHNIQTNFFEEIRYIYELRERTVALLETMPSRFYTKYLLSEVDLEEWDKLMKEKKETSHYLISILTKIIKINDPIKSMEVVPLNTPGNKTLQYYARKALVFIKQQHLTGIWEDFRRLPPKKQLLEKAAGFIAQWYQADTDLSDKDIDNDLDKIASLVKQRLFEMNPNHQIFKAIHLEKLKEENLDGNLWSVDECRQVMKALREVLYIRLGYCGNGDGDNYYLKQPDNLLINKVIEYRTGHRIILAIIHESVGRRLGLLFEPIDFPDRFVLRFTETEGSRRSVYYIEPFSNGAFIEEPTGPQVLPEEPFPVFSTQQIVDRIVDILVLSTEDHSGPNGRNTCIQQSMLELQLLVTPFGFDIVKTVLNLDMFYTSHKVNTKKLEPYTKPPGLGVILGMGPPDPFDENIVVVEDTTQEFDDLNIQTKSFQVQRTEDVKYAVGMILEDSTHNEQCVIFDWVFEYESPPFQFPLPSPSLSPTFSTHRKKQPHYSVLSEDGFSRILPQGSAKFSVKVIYVKDVVAPSSDVGRLLTHKELGRYFSHFFVNHFVPNAEKEREYPWDKEVRHKYYYDQLLKQHPF